MGEDDRYLYFTADVPGYASFAISGNAKGIPGNISEEKSGLETRALQGNKSKTSLDTGGDTEEGRNAKISEISPVYGTIGILLLSLISLLIYRKLPK